MANPKLYEYTYVGTDDRYYMLQNEDGSTVTVTPGRTVTLTLSPDQVTADPGLHELVPVTAMSSASAAASVPDVAGKDVTAPAE